MNIKITGIKIVGIHYTSVMVRDGEFHSHPGKAHDAVQSMLEIHCDDGTVGRYVGPMAEDVIIGAKSLIVGENPLYRERIWHRLVQFQRLKTELVERTLCAIDCALWDIAGKVCNLPAYQIIGAQRDKVAAYGSIMVGDDIKGALDTPENYAKYAKYLVDTYGYKAIKLHTWMPPIIPEPDIKMDIRACEKVREAVGPDVELMLDPYHFYSREEALRLADALHSLNFLWMEEPMDEHSMSSYVWLTKETKLPICGPETVEGKLYMRSEWVKNSASDIGRCGCLCVGGITSALKTIHMYEANNMSVELHGNHIGNLHLLGSMGIDGKYFERGLHHPLIDYNKPSPWLKEIYDPMDKDGFVKIPSDPGLGYKFDFDYIKDNTKYVK